MDTSDKYIKMCKEAKEIQELDKEDDYHNFWSMESVDDSEWKTQYIWLPRQDQLQEMIEHDGITDLIDKLDEFECWWADTHDNRWAIDDTFKSMEQLWLAFTMHEKYGKLWDNEKEIWVK